MASTSLATVPKPFVLERIRDIHLDEVTIPQLQAYYSSGRLTSAEYTAYCLGRIRRTDPYLEAVIETNPDALSIATELDQERRDGKVRGPLHGTPVLVKDNIATADKMQTTAGSWALLGSLVPRDAFVAKKLREAGVVILGHTTMGEWASCRSKDSSTSYSPRRGQCRNPYDLTQSPYGSSGGSAVAVSANVGPLSIGTETDCSIIGPGIMNGIVRIKPTVGLTSRAGVIPISENQDTVGPFGRTVLDATIGLSAIVGKDERDTFTLVPKREQETDYTAFVTDRHALKGARFGLPMKRVWNLVKKDHGDIAMRLIDAIKEAGADVIETDFPCYEDRIREDGVWDWEHGSPDKSEWTVMKVDAYNDLNSYLSELSETDIKFVEDIVAFNEANRHTEGADPGDHPAFVSGQDNFHEIVATKGKKDATYNAALKHVHHMCREQGIDAALNHTTPDGKDVELDALILCDHKGTGQQIAAQAGYPIVCIPIGIDDDGLPIGLSLQHTAWQEAKLVKWASAIEDLRNHVLGGRPLPTFKNHRAKNLPMRDL